MQNQTCVVQGQTSPVLDRQACVSCICLSLFAFNRGAFGLPSLPVKCMQARMNTWARIGFFGFGLWARGLGVRVVGSGNTWARIASVHAHIRTNRHTSWIRHLSSEHTFEHTHNSHTLSARHRDERRVRIKEKKQFGVVQEEAREVRQVDLYVPYTLYPIQYTIYQIPYALGPRQCTSPKTRNPKPEI